MEQNINTYTIKLVKSAITDKKDNDLTKEKFTQEILQEIYHISQQQDIQHLVFQGLYNNGLIDDSSELYKKFLNKRMSLLLKSEQQKFELDRIKSLFEKLQVPFIPLKGSVLRKYYPEEWMRTSCDIDILIKPENIEKCVNALTQDFSFTVKKIGEYDISLYSPGKVHLELHFGFMESMFKASKSLDKIWDSVKQVSTGRYEYIMPDDVFYYHQVVHMAKHFEYGGCGLRFFIDIWILNHSSDFIKTTKSERLLAEVGLVKFEHVMLQVSEVWFTDKTHNDLTRRVENYIMSSGLYGNSQNLMATKQIKSGGKKKYAFSRVFLSYEKLLELYPSLYGKKFLIPWYQMRRWFSIIFSGRFKLSYKELSLNSKISESRKNSIADLFKDLGFSEK